MLGSKHSRRRRLGGNRHQALSTFSPIHRSFGVNDHWSVDQREYATDVVFRKQAGLQPIYGNLSRTAIHTVKPGNIATFLGRKLPFRKDSCPVERSFRRAGCLNRAGCRLL